MYSESISCLVIREPYCKLGASWLALPLISKSRGNSLARYQLFRGSAPRS